MTGPIRDGVQTQFRGVGELLQKIEHPRGLLIGLREHGRAGLLQDLEPDHFCRRPGHVDIANAALGFDHIVTHGGKVLYREREPALYGAYQPARRGEARNSGVYGIQRSLTRRLSFGGGAGVNRIAKPALAGGGES